MPQKAMSTNTQSIFQRQPFTQTRPSLSRLSTKRLTNLKRLACSTRHLEVRHCTPHVFNQRPFEDHVQASSTASLGGFHGHPAPRSKKVKRNSLNASPQKQIPMLNPCHMEVPSPSRVHPSRGVTALRSASLPSSVKHCVQQKTGRRPTV